MATIQIFHVISAKRSLLIDFEQQGRVFQVEIGTRAAYPTAACLVYRSQAYQRGELLGWNPGIHGCPDLGDDHLQVRTGKTFRYAPCQDRLGHTWEVQLPTISA